MFRSAAAGFVCLLLLSGTGHAQSIYPAYGPARIRIAPYVAYSFPATRIEDRVIEFGNLLQPYRAEFELGAGYGGGLHIDVPLQMPVAFFASGSFLRRDASFEYSELEGGTRVEEGSDYAAARAGLSIRLQQEPRLQLRQLSASIYAGPMFLREMPRTDRFRTAADAINLFGTHAGLDAELPLGRRTSLSAGFESNVVWWQDAELGRRNDSVYESIGIETLTTVTSRPTPIWTIRFGFTIQP